LTGDQERERERERERKLCSLELPLCEHFFPRSSKLELFFGAVKGKEETISLLSPFFPSRSALICIKAPWITWCEPSSLFRWYLPIQNGDILEKPFIDYGSLERSPSVFDATSGSSKEKDFFSF
jgi:hypothetical protein